MKLVRTSIALSGLIGLAFALAWSGAQAAPPGARRLQITIEAQRDAAFAGVERGQAKLTQQVSFSAVLHTDGVANTHNPLDPDDGARQLQRGQRTQQRVQAALDRQGVRAPAAAPTMADVQQMQLRAQQMQAKCGADRECLMREASAMSAAQVAGGDRALQARLQGYGAAVQACERSANAAAREACIADARRRAGGSDETDHDEAVEAPYLYFRGQGACQLDVSTRIDERIEGRFDDVQGVVPFTQTTQVDQRRRDDTVCPLVQAVLDTRNGRLWTQVLTGVPQPSGVTVRSEKGRAPQRNEGQVSVQWHEASDWVQKRLSHLSAAGEDRARLPAGTGGQLEVKARWRFDPV